MIPSIDRPDQSAITHLYVITQLIVLEIILVEETETMDRHHVNVTILRITPLHVTILPWIAIICHLVVGIILPVDVTTSFHEMILTWVLVVMLPGTMFPFFTA